MLPLMLMVLQKRSQERDGEKLRWLVMVSCLISFEISVLPDCLWEESHVEPLEPVVGQVEVAEGRETCQQPVDVLQLVGLQVEPVEAGEGREDGAGQARQPVVGEEEFPQPGQVGELGARQGGELVVREICPEQG